MTPILANIWDLFGLDVEDGAEWSIEWAPAWPAWVTAIIVVPALVLFVMYCYRRHQTPGSRGRRVLLAATRFTVLLCVLLMLFDPILAVEKQVRRRSYVAVLIDDSASMEFKDHYDPGSREEERLIRAAGWVEPDAAIPALTRDRLQRTTRWQLMREVLKHHEHQFLTKLAETHTVKIYTFSTRLRRDPDLNPKAPSTPEGAHTKLGDAIRDALDDLKGQSIAGIVVLTDGRSNAGEHSPVEAARMASEHGAGVPVFAIGVGAEKIPSDVRLEQVRAPSVVLKDEQVSIEFSVSHTGFDNDRITVELHKDGVEGPIEADTQIDLVDRTRDTTTKRRPQRAILKVKPFDEEGEYELVLHIPPDERDTVPENNTKRLRIRVVDGKLKVLYVDGRPRFEYRHFSLALTRDERVAANVLLADSDVGVVQRHSDNVRSLSEFPRIDVSRGGERGLFDFDVIIIGDVAFDARPGLGIFADPDAQMKLVERFVEEVGGGVIFLAGPDACPDRYRGTPLEHLLPVDLLSTDERTHEDHQALSDALIKPDRTADGTNHVLLQLHPDTSSNVPNDLLWDTLPGFFWTAPVRGAKLHAKVLLESPHAGPHGKRPVLATMWYGRGRTVFVGTDEIWRWRELQGDRYYYRFFSNLIRFVGNSRLLGDERRFEIALEKSRFTLGERVVVRARKLSDSFKPSLEPEVEVMLEAGDHPPQAIRLERPDERRPGEYEGSFMAGRLGPHRLWFEHRRGNLAGKAAVISFDVVVPQREMENPALHVAELQGVWEESRATAAAKEAGVDRDRFFRLWELPVVARAIPPRSILLTGVDATYRLWDSWLAYALILGLLCLEWIVRKLTRLP